MRWRTLWDAAALTLLRADRRRGHLGEIERVLAKS
jgi:hypothetical protein